MNIPQEHASSNQTKAAVEDAISVINEVITEYDNKLLSIKGDENANHVVYFKGVTNTGFDVTLSADLSNIVGILNKYDYSIYTALNLNYPDGMWDELADLLGLKGVSYMDF